MVGGTKIDAKNVKPINNNLGEMQRELARTTPEKAKIDSYLKAITASLPAGSKTADIRKEVLKGMEADLKGFYKTDAAVDSAIGGK